MSNEDGDQRSTYPKVFERQGLLIGVSGEMRVAQLIKHVWDVPVITESQDPEQFVVRDFCSGLRGFLREHADELVPSPEDDEMWSLLVGTVGRVFRICSHFSVYESTTGYDAIGSGSPHALGSFASTEDRAPRDRVETALRAAERHQSGVAGPFTVLAMPVPAV